MKRSDRLFKFLDNHFEITGTNDPLGWNESWKRIKKVKEDEKLKLCSYIDPFAVVNIDLNKINLGNRLYRGGIIGPAFQEFFTLIKKQGVLNPVIAYTVTEDDVYWRKKKKPYNPNTYVIYEGGHRTVACQYWNILMPAWVLV